MFDQGNELTGALKTSQSSTPQKTMLQSLGARLPQVNTGNLSNNKLSSQANSAGSVAPKQGAVATAKTSAQDARAAISTCIQHLQRAVKAAAEFTGNKVPHIPKASGDTARTLGMAADTVTGGALSIGLAAKEATLDGGSEWDATAETQVQNHLIAMQDDGLTPCDWRSFFDEGYDALDILRVDADNPSVAAIPEMKAVLQVEAAVNSADQSLDHAKQTLDTQHVGLTSAGLCGITACKIPEGCDAEVAAVAGVKALLDGKNGTPDAPSLSAEYKPAAQSPSMPV